MELNWIEYKYVWWETIRSITTTTLLLFFLFKPHHLPLLSYARSWVCELRLEVNCSKLFSLIWWPGSSGSLKRTSSKERVVPYSQEMVESVNPFICIWNIQIIWQESYRIVCWCCFCAFEDSEEELTIDCNCMDRSNFCSLNDRWINNDWILISWWSIPLKLGLYALQC